MSPSTRRGERLLPRMADTIIGVINRATESLDIAIYNIDNDNGIIDAINAASTNGVAVRMVVNEGVSATNYNAMVSPV